MKKTIDFISAELFILYAFYQALTLTIPGSSKASKVVSIIIYSVIAAALFLSRNGKPSIQFAGTIVLTVGLALDFVIKSLSSFGIFGALDPADTRSVLECDAFVLSQICVFILLAVHLLLRNTVGRKMNPTLNRVISVILLSAVIIMLFSRLLIDCFLVVDYRVHIDFNTRATLLSRLVYCLGFTCMAIGMMFSPPAKVKKTARSSPEEKPNRVSLEINKDFVM